MHAPLRAIEEGRFDPDGAGGEMETLLVSGGFTFFANRVRALLDIDFARSNVLEIENGQLTGRMVVNPGATFATAPRNAACCSRWPR